MQPIRTERSTFVLRTPSAEVPDMPGERVKPGHIRSIWELTQREREAIAEGLNIELDIFGEPIPAVSLDVTHEGATLVGTRAILIADRFMATDGRWYIRLLSEGGGELGISKAYRYGWSAWLALRSLKRILPTVEISPS